jgi:polar amino acid transport system substrate-binding protein
MSASRAAVWGLLVLALAIWLFPHERIGLVDANTTQATLERIRATGVARVGYANEAPFAYHDSATQRLTGEAPEVARVVLGQLGVRRIEGVLTDFGSLIPGLQAGRFDLIAAGMYITPPRCRQVLFTNPTYAIGEALLVRRGNPLELHSFEDLIALPDARLGVVTGTIQIDYARGLGIDPDRLLILPDPPSALAALEADRIDAYAATALTVQDLLQRRANHRVERAEPFRNPLIDGKDARGYGAFALRKEDTALRRLIDEQLAAFLGTPAHRELVAPFGFTPTELPGAATSEALCAGDAP